MIRVREFADKVGCTPQNIYLHLKTYAKELEGHTQQGRRGVMLDDYAQDFIRSVMYPKEISADTELMEELNRLRGALLKAGQENARLATKLAETESQRDRALLEAGEIQKALAASQEAEEARAAELQRAHEDYRQAAEALEQMRAEATQRLQEAEAAEERELQAQKEAEELRSQLETVKKMPFWQRIFWKG